MRKKTIWIDITILKINSNCGMAAFTKTYIEILKNNYNIKYFSNPFYKNKFLGSKLYFIWLNTYFYLQTLLLKPDIIIYPCYIMPYFTRRNTKNYVVFHDLMPYRENFFGEKCKKSYLFKLNIAKEKSTKIITVSNTVKKQLIKEFNLPENRIGITYNCVNDVIKHSKEDSNILNKLNLKSNNYIFSLAGSFKHKNIQELIAAINNIKEDIKLVVAGYKGHLQYSDSEISNKKIIYAGYITTEEIIALYKNAKFFVLPSLEEGFGIPIIESQYFQCPVLCSDIPIFREVAGNGAEFCIPDSNGIAAKLEYLINNGQRRQELISLGKENVKRFSIEKIARQLSDVLEN